MRSSQELLRCLPSLLAWLRAVKRAANRRMTLREAKQMSVAQLKDTVVGAHISGLDAPAVEALWEAYKSSWNTARLLIRKFGCRVAGNDPEDGQGARIWPRSVNSPPEMHTLLTHLH